MKIGEHYIKCQKCFKRFRQSKITMLGFCEECTKTHMKEMADFSAKRVLKRVADSLYKKDCKGKRKLLKDWGIIND